MRTANDPGLPAAADALLGSMRLDVDAVTAWLLDRVARTRPGVPKAAVVKMIAGRGPPYPRAPPIFSAGGD